MVDQATQDEIDLLYSWLKQILAQLYDETDRKIDLPPFNEISARLEALKEKLIAQNVQPPIVRSHDFDPLGCWTDWRDYLKGMVNIQ